MHDGFRSKFAKGIREFLSVGDITNHQLGAADRRGMPLHEVVVRENLVTV
jgi:hypothetical protein